MTQNYHYEYDDYKKHRDAGLDHSAAITAARADNVWRWRNSYMPIYNAGHMREWRGKMERLMVDQSVCMT